MSVIFSKKEYIATHKKVLYWFRVLNNSIFSNLVHYPKEVKIYNIGDDAFGYCKVGGYENEKSPKYWSLHLSKKYPQFITFLEVLGHEMVHAYDYWYNTKNYFKSVAGHTQDFFSWKPHFDEVGLMLSAKIYNPEDSETNRELLRKKLIRKH
jgi:hypothetical protein